MRRKMTMFEHITRHDSLANTIMYVYIEVKRKKGSQEKLDDPYCDGTK